MLSPSQNSASGCFLGTPSTNLLTNSVFKAGQKQVTTTSSAPNLRTKRHLKE